jgi:hypothetical protein
MREQTNVATAGLIRELLGTDSGDPSAADRGQPATRREALAGAAAVGCELDRELQRSQ